MLADGPAVVDGIGVGHRAHGGETAGGGRGQARVDGLGVLAAGLAQVGVEVDESRQNETARGVEDLRIRILEALAHASDDAVAQEQVQFPVDARGRVDHATAAQQQAAAHSPSQGWPPRRR